MPTIREALKELVALKDLKEERGKTAEYIRRMPGAWAAAREALRNAEWLPTVHPDWDEDGIEDGENLWRLDLANDIQVQLFASVDDCDEYTGEFRLFIEHDVRDETGANRVRYAGQFFWCGRSLARSLLEKDAAAVATYIAGQIAAVVALPDQPEFH